MAIQDFLIRLATDPMYLAYAILWMLPWKSWALWSSARNKQRIWFFIFIIIHTLGVLEIIYLLFFRNDKN